MNRLKGKIALITGAARGIGEAIAYAFLDEGAIVYLSDISDELGNNAAKKFGSFAKYVRLDVRNEQDWASVTKSIIDAHGAIDIVVNNAGITGFENGDLVHDPENASLEAWRDCPSNQS